MVSIFFPDVSHYQAGLQLKPDTAFVWAKATEGTGYSDDSFSNFRAQAGAKGIPFGAYHYLRDDYVSSQARFAFNRVGSSTPLMVDVEIGSGDIANLLGFVSQYRGLGGKCHVAYIPRWYWSSIGSPSLTPLTNAGLALVSSNYTTYSDSGPGWTWYGGVGPKVWQYSDHFLYNGYYIDFNAYRGSLQEYLSLVTGDPQPPVNPPAPIDPNASVVPYQRSSDMYKQLNPGETCTFTPDSVSSGYKSWLSLAAEFNDLTARVVWWGPDNAEHEITPVPVTVAQADCLPLLMDITTRKVSVTHTGSAGLLGVSTPPTIVATA